MDSILTLGPAGTCSEKAASFYLSLRALNIPVNLISSYEKAIQSLVKNQASHVIVPVAYTKLYKIIFENNDKIKVVDSFYKHTSTFVLAGNKSKLDWKEKMSIAIHPSPEPILKKLNFEYEPIYAQSNSEAAIIASNNQADLTLTTLQAAKMHNLKIYTTMGQFQMYWLVFAKA